MAAIGVRGLVLAAALAAAPFWETRPPAEWTDDQVRELLTDSPWAQQAVSARSAAGVPVYLATAEPLRDAERELERRANIAPDEDPGAEEYASFLAGNAGKIIVLAVGGVTAEALADPAEIRRMEERSVLSVGKRQYKIVGHFLPSPSDPMLRLVFPRAVTEADPKFRFELYVPGARDPYRFAEFRTAALRYKGSLERGL